MQIFKDLACVKQQTGNLFFPSAPAQKRYLCSEGGSHGEIQASPPHRPKTEGS